MFYVHHQGHEETIKYQTDNKVIEIKIIKIITEGLFKHQERSLNKKISQ